MTRRWKIVSFDLFAAGLAALLALLFLTATANASNPTTMSFQGKVVNANGTNVTDGSYGFTFKLYTASSGGSAVWTENDTLTVTAGVFQVNLGAVCPFFTANACNSSTPIDFSVSNSLYLGITFNSDPAGEMTPRVQLQSVPYAFYADNAGSLGGRAASGYIQLSPSSSQTGSINILGADSFINNTGSNNTSIGGASGTLNLGGASTGIITLQSANAINVTAGAASTWNFGSNTLAITSSKLTVDTSGKISAGTIGSASASTLVDAGSNVNSGTFYGIHNNSNGTSAASGFTAYNDNAGATTHYGLFGIGGTGYTGVAILQNYAFADAGAGTNGLALNTQAALPILVGINNTEVARFSSTGNLLLGNTTGTNLLSVGSSSQFTVSSTGIVTYANAASTGTTLVCSNSSQLAGCDPTFINPTAANFIKNQNAVQTSASFFIQPGSSNVGGVIKANGADTLDIQNSGGSVVAKFDANGNITAVGGTFSAQVTDTLTLTASGSGVFGTLTAQPASAPGSSSGYTAVGGSTTASGANVNANVIARGVYGSAVNGSSNTLGTAQGVFGQIFSAGNITTAVGAVGDIINSGSGTFTSGYALQALAPSSASGTIATAAGLDIQGQKVTGVTNAYGILQEGANDINSFKGNVAIGYTTAPTSLSNPLNVGTTGQFSVNSSGAITAVTGITNTGNISATGRINLPITSGTAGQGYFVNNGSSVPVTSFQGLDTGTNSFGFFGVNKYYNGTAWVDDGQSRVGSSFQVQDNTFNFYQFDTAANFHSRLVLNASGNVGIGQDVSPSYLLDVQGGDINTSANVRTGGTVRLDNAGNLSNIGNITATGNTTISNAGAGNDIAITSQDAINLTTGANGLTVSTNGAAAATAINVTDGTNTLAKIVDAGTYGELQLGVKGTTGNDASQCAAAGDVGKIYVNSVDKAVFACTASGAWEQLDNSRSSVTQTAGTFTVSTTNTLVDSVSITPTTANSDVWIRYNGEINLGCTGLGCVQPTVLIRIVRGTTCAGTVIDTLTHIGNGPNSTTLGESFIDTAPTGPGVSNTYVICAQRTAGSGTITNTITGRSLIASEIDTSGADYAETYYSANGRIEPGTVVISDPSIAAGVTPSSNRYQKGLMGVVSTQPGQVLADSTNSGTPVIVALAGRVPVKVSTENGSIKPGDYLTSSSIPGVAMRATKAGNVIGTAMESYDTTGTGSITAFVNDAQFTGVLPLNTDGSSPDSQQLLVALLAGQAQPNQNSDVSQVFTDHLAASVDVVTPTVIADKVQTSTIVIGKDGINFTDETGKVVAAIDSAGTFTSQPASPAAATTTPTTNDQPTPTTTGFSLKSPTGTELVSFDSAGTASFKGDLNFGNAVASGGLQIGGDLNVNGLSSFQKLATFFAKTIFRQDVEFDGRITVSKDTAGYAKLRSGETLVHVSFTTPYTNMPIVTVNYSDGQFGLVTTSNITASGFDITVPAAATVDTTFSWTAIGVIDPQTATNAPAVTP